MLLIDDILLIHNLILHAGNILRRNSLNQLLTRMIWLHLIHWHSHVALHDVWIGHSHLLNLLDSIWARNFETS